MEQAAIFFRRHDADRRIESAKIAMRALLPLELEPAHKRELLSICLWKLTEAEGGKYGTRYRSAAAMGAPPKSLAHEHVFQRAKLVKALLAEPHRRDEIAKQAVGCVVTRAEHATLNKLGVAQPDLDGWARYREAGTVVIDTLTREQLDTG